MDFMTVIRCLRDGSAKRVKPVSWGDASYVFVGINGMLLCFTGVRTQTPSFEPTDFTQEWEVIE